MASPPRPTAGPSKRSSRSSGSIRKKLTGRWRLVSYSARPDRGREVYPLGAAAMGERYFAYYGYYSVDEKARTVTHHLELCSDHNLAGASNLRHIALEGARLVLSGSMELDGKPHTIRVVWERQAAESKNRR